MIKVQENRILMKVVSFFIIISNSFVLYFLFLIQKNDVELIWRDISAAIDDF